MYVRVRNVLIVCIFCWCLLVTCFTKSITFGDDGKTFFCLSIFAIEPIPDACLFLAYWPSKNESRANGIKGEFVSPAKYNVFSATGRSILCWQMFAIEHLAEFSLFLDYWPSKMGNDVKSESVSLPKLIPIVFSTSGPKSFMSVNFFINRICCI